MTRDLEFATKPCCDDCVHYSEWREPHPYGSTVAHEYCVECMMGHDTDKACHACPDLKEKPCP